MLKKYIIKNLTEATSPTETAQFQVGQIYKAWSAVDSCHKFHALNLTAEKLQTEQMTGTEKNN